MRMGGFVAAGLIVLAFSGALAAGELVVTNTYENLDAKRALTNVPVTFSRIGADGDFTAGITPTINGRKLPAQVDVLRRADDGSIRHALVSFVLPGLPAGGTAKVDWVNAAPLAPPAFEWAVNQAQLDLKLTLQPASGPALTSDLGTLLGDDWAKSKGVKVLYDGPVMKEFELHDVPVGPDGAKSKRLDVYWRLRVFTGQKSIRVAAVVERCKPRVRPNAEPIQYKVASVKLTAGEKVLYQEGAYDHLDQTRYRILVWTDGALENIHRRPNYAYWVKGKFVPLYRWSGGKNWSAKKVDDTFAKRTKDRNNQKRRQGILEPGIIHRHMPGTGGRWEMEPYSAWVVGYLLSGGAKTYLATLHGDGNGAGAFYIHVRQDVGTPGYNVFTVANKPLDRGFRMPLYRLPDGTKPPVQPDHAHAPSIGYISYLLTGDKYYAEEASFWAAYQMGEWPHKGLRWGGMDRAFAYGLRHVVDAAFILPDGDPLKDYFTGGVNKCLDQMTTRLVKSGRRVHSPLGGQIKVSGRSNWVNATQTSAWQYAWVVWSLGNTADKGFPKAEAVRDWAAEYIVGFYTSDDEFKAPDGKVYRYDPKDAMPYSTATEVVPTEVVTDANGKKTIKTVGKPRLIDNYGEIWYYTKVNTDNGWEERKGLRTEPDADGVWPLREKGWGHGKTWNHVQLRQERWYAWHRYGAWTGMVSAIEGDVPKAKEAWKVMTSLAGGPSYGYEMVPRTGLK